jgi:membrane protease YdiL (CAAX protease family)
MEFIKKNPLLSYVFIAYGFTWIVLGLLIWLYNTIPPVYREIWHILGALGPAISAIVVIKIWKGKEGLKELGKRCIKYAGIGLLVFSLLPILVFALIFPIEHFLGSFTIADLLSAFSQEYGGVIWLFPLASFSYGIFEEIGWRGFLLPYLQRKYNPLISSLILTPIWWLWHVPMFFYRYDLFFAVIIMPLLMFSGTLVFTWLFNTSKGSLLMTIIIHISYDLISAHNTGISTMVVSVLWVVVDIVILLIYVKNYKKQGILQEKIVI